MIQVKLLGSGGTYPVPHRYLTSLYAFINGSGVLFDCGEGTQVAHSAAEQKLLGISVICLTHSHSDHVLGIPGLLASIDQAMKLNKPDETKTIYVIAPKSCKDVFNNLRYSIRLKNVHTIFLPLEGNKETFDFAGFSIEAYRVKHSVDCYGFNVTERINPKFCQEKAEACPLPPEGWKFLQAGYTIVFNRELYTIKDITSDERIGAKIAYVTDTLPCDAITECVTGADLAVLEGMYFNAENSAKQVKSQHMTFEEAATIAKKAGAKELWLTHFSPTLSAPYLGLEYATNIFPNTKCGEDGLGMEVTPSVVKKEKDE